MRCRVVFNHPHNVGDFYFVDFKNSPKGLLPVGCWMLRSYRHRASIFATKRDAEKVVEYLSSIGYKARSVKVNP